MSITLTWKVSKTVPTACPDFKPDPYTGELPSTHCLVYHCETVTEKRSAVFATQEEADLFKKNAPSNCVFD